MHTTLVMQLINTITDTFGTRITLDQLRAYVARRRGKPLHVHTSSLLGADDSGACVATTTADVILLAPNLDAVLVVMTQLHEIGHMLLHMPSKTVDFSYETFISAMHLTTAPTIRRHTETMETAYDTPMEREAELFASLLYPAIHDDYRPPLELID